MASSVEFFNKQVTGYPASISTATGTTTGYVTGIPQPPPPSSALYPSVRYSQRSSFLRQFMTALLLALLILGAISLLFHFVLRPPLLEFRVTGATVSAINSSDAELWASWNISIVAKNSDRKLSVYYDRLEVAVLYGDAFLLSEIQLPVLDQGKNNQTQVNARLAVGGANVGKDIVRGILRDKSRGVVSFRVRIMALATFRCGEWLTRSRLVKADCNRIDFGFSSSSGMGTFLRPGKKCEVSL